MPSSKNRSEQPTVPGEPRHSPRLERHHIIRFLLISACYLGLTPAIGDPIAADTSRDNTYLTEKDRS